jgi:glycosyltransferase involved in cell wall biosynthesis
MDAFKPRPDARENLRTSLRLNHSALLVGMVARYDPVKDHQSFLSAAAQLSQEIDNVHFVLVGRDERDQLRRAVLEMGLSDRVHLLGERTDIAEINAGLDVATLTSSFGEGFPNVLGEAMACGIPCVSTDVGDARTVVGDHGIIVPPANVTALGRAWAGILRMPASERKRIGEEGRNRIVQNFSIAVVAAQYEQLFTKLAS